MFQKYISELKNNSINYIKTHTIQHFSIVSTYNCSLMSNKDFLMWLKKYDKNFNLHIIQTDKNKYSLREDVDIFIKIDNFTFANIYMAKDPDNSYYLKIRFIGKHAFRELYNIERMHKDAYIKITNHYTTKIVNGDIRFTMNSVNERGKDTVFLNDSINNKLINHVDKFFSNREMYSNRNIKYKTGILLYGEPGTGKSTIINMLATIYKCSIITIPMYDFEDFDVDQFSSILDDDNNTYIVALEDIDCIINNRKDGDREDQKIINKLLQLLDSASSPSNVIFVATTNHIDKLDTAITRDGRFDLKLHIGFIDKHNAIKMIKSFGIVDVESIKSILESTTKNKDNDEITYNPASLQNSIIKVLETYD